jgi:hypothetical protein
MSELPGISSNCSKRGYVRFFAWRNSAHDGKYYLEIRGARGNSEGTRGTLRAVEAAMPNILDRNSYLTGFANPGIG